MMSSDYGPEVLPPSDLEVHHQPANTALLTDRPYQLDQPDETSMLRGGKSSGTGYPHKSRELGRWSLAALAALLTMVIVGGALGGGLGATLSNCQSAKSALSANSGLVSTTITVTASPTSASSATMAAAKSSTSSPTTSIATPLINYAVAAPTDVESVSLNCQNGNITEQTSLTGTFNVYCGTDFGGNQVSTTQDSSGKALPYVDLLGIIAYSQSACMQACLEYNHWSNILKYSSPMFCRSIHFASGLRSAISANGANCWIKNGTPADTTLLSNTEGLGVFSATLVSGTDQ